MGNKKVLYGNVLKVTRYDTLDDIRDIFKQMTESGFNTVVVWPAVFWWEEKGENYPFETGRQILKIADEIGIKVIMELAGQLTSMEYMPDFLNKPEYYPSNLQGAREYGQNSFGFVNYFHPEVKAIIAQHYTKAAEMYRDFDSLLGYDVFNETMYRSFDQYTMANFQDWLKDKYGAIENLNKVWERTYSDFSQIGYEQWKWMSVMPEADYFAYRKAAIPRFIKPWCDAIRKVDKKHLLIADNIHSMSAPNAMYSRPQDDYSLTEFADKIGMSFYPKSAFGVFDDALRWQIFDGYYDASGREGFYISEMQTHIQAMFYPTTCVKPYELKLWCAEAYAAGAESIIYWMWRPFSSGIQNLGRGLVNYQGLPTERLDAAKAVNENILKYGKLSPVKSEIAILFDPLCDDVQRAYTGVDNPIYLKSIHGAYKAFRTINVRCDIIRYDEIYNYKAVIITNHSAISKDNAKKLYDYVENGGRLIIDGRSGITDEFARSYSTIPLGGYNHLIGEVYFDTDDEDSTILVGNSRIKAYNGRFVSNIIDADVVAEFGDGMPAIVEKKIGLGSAVTINASVWYGYSDDNTTAVEFAKQISKNLNLYQLVADTQLKLRVSEDSENYYLFAFNYTNVEKSAEVSVNLEKFSKLVNVCVKPNDVKIIKIEKENM